MVNAMWVLAERFEGLVITSDRNDYKFDGTKLLRSVWQLMVTMAGSIDRLQC